MFICTLILRQALKNPQIFPFLKQAANLDLAGGVSV